MKKKEDLVMGQSTTIELARRMLVDSIWKAANVEGLGTTLSATESILQNVPVRTRRDEVLFVVNMKKAWELLFETLGYPVDLNFMRELNKVCMVDLGSEPGIIREHQISVGGTSWKPELPYIPDVLAQIQRISEEKDCVEKAFDMYCYLCRLQLFYDGNIRLAQLVANKLLIEGGVGILSIPVESVSDFMRKLLSMYETGDYEELKVFLRDCITYDAL